tara:strand:- start:4 stop:114 length:111 start_codon:yes stop_codon:yes gene_type:complete
MKNKNNKKTILPVILGMIGIGLTITFLKLTYNILTT